MSGLRSLRVDPLLGASLAAIGLRHPWLALPVLAAPLWSSLARRADRRRLARQADADVALLPRILLVGLAGGLPLRAALELASGHVGPVVRAELSGLLRVARRRGLALALTTRTSGLTRPLFARLALAQASGAPMVDALTAYLAESRSIRRGEAIERVRRLPVTLMIPLGLLILPGFVVLFVGPILLDSLADLAGYLP